MRTAVAGDRNRTSPSRAARRSLDALRARAAGLFPTTVRGVILLLIFAMLLPEVLIEVSHYYSLYQDREKHELQSNLELAQSVGSAFEDYVQGVLREELAVGVILSSAKSMPVEQVKQILAASATEHPGVRYLTWMDAEGRALVTSRSEVVRPGIGDRPRAQPILDGREWVVGDLSLGQLSGEPGFAIVRGIRDEAGNLLGMVGAQVDPRGFRELLKVRRVGLGTISLVDSKGYLVYRDPGGDVPWGERNMLVKQPVFARTLAGEEVTDALVSPVDGQKRLVAHTPISSIGWVAAASRPEAEAMAPVTDELIHEAGWKLILLALLFLLGLAIARAITVPLRRLREHATALGQGELDRRVEFVVPTEMEELAGSFNRMADALEMRTKAMELMVDAIGPVAGASSLNRALHELGSNLAQAIGVPICQVATLTDDGQALVVRASYSSIRPGPSPFLGHAFPLDEVPPARQVIDGKQCVEITSPESGLLNQAERERWNANGLNAALGVPLVARDRVLGLLSLGDVKSRVFTEYEKRLCTAVAKQVSLAVEKAELYRQMAQERERLDAIIRNTSDGVLIVDRERRVLAMNPAMERLSGWTSEEVRGRPCREVFRSRDQKGVSLCDTACPVLRTMTSGTAVPSAEVTITRKDGQTRDLSVSYVYVPMPSAEAGYCVAIGRDISKAKEVERLKDEFVSLLSHDLRAPLTIVQGQAQLIQRFIDRVDLVREGSKAIIAGSRRMEAMIGDLVDSVRLESGQLRLERHPLQLRLFVSDLLERARVSMDVKRVETDLPADLPTVGADPNALERVLVNLIGNSLKYSPAGAVVVVGAKVDGGEVVTSVSDQGVGIAPEDLPRIFERYYRVKEVRKAEGLGLGLYIARMLVEAQGGRIWVESDVGKGSTFYFALPPM